MPRPIGDRSGRTPGGVSVYVVIRFELLEGPRAAIRQQARHLQSDRVRKMNAEAEPWHPDREFIALEERIAEMRGYGWIDSTDAGWRLNDRGRRVVRLRQALLRALRIEAVG